MTHPTRNATLLLALGILVALPILADHHEKSEGAPDMAEAMAAMNEAMTPGEHHEFLASLAGEWTYTSTMWMDPSQPPMKTSGESEKSMILGGRYLQERSSGNMMGMTFNGRGVTGFDNLAGNYVNTWIDNMGTGVLITQGQRDGKTLTMKGEMTDPMSRQAMKVRMVTSVIDADHHHFDFYIAVPGGEELKSMEIDYARKAE